MDIWHEHYMTIAREVEQRMRDIHRSIDRTYKNAHNSGEVIEELSIMQHHVDMLLGEIKKSDLGVFEDFAKEAKIKEVA